MGEEACKPSATRMVFPNRDDPDKVLNIVFNAFFYDPYDNTPLGHTDMLLPDMPAPAWPAAESCGNPTGTKCEYGADTATVSGGGDLFVASYVEDEIDNANNVVVQGSIGVIEVDATMHLPLGKNQELRVHIINDYISEGSVVLATLADFGSGGWAMVRDAKIDAGGGGAVVVVKNLCHELLGTVGGSTTEVIRQAGRDEQSATCETPDNDVVESTCAARLPSDRATFEADDEGRQDDDPDFGTPLCAYTDADLAADPPVAEACTPRDGSVNEAGTNKVKVGFVVFSASEDEQAKDFVDLEQTVRLNHCDPNPCTEHGDTEAQCSSEEWAEFSHTCACSAGYGGAACEPCADLTAPASNCFEESCTGATPHWCPAGASANAETCVSSCASCGDYTTDPVTFSPWVYVAPPAEPT